MDRVWSRALIAGHALIWVALSLYAFDAATQNKFASCWTLWGSLFYLPVLTIALFSFPYVALRMSRPSMRPRLPFLMACHGVTLTTGFASTILATVTAAGPVACL
jgi:hypothetical protein